MACRAIATLLVGAAMLPGCTKGSPAPTDPQGLAEELLLLMDGAWSAARVFGPGSHASRVGRAARELIAQHIAGPDEVE